MYNIVLHISIHLCMYLYIYLFMYYAISDLLVLIITENIRFRPY